jgi:hypothetical protein
MDIRPPERIAPEPAGKKLRDRILLRTGAWGLCAAFAAGILFVVAQGPAASQRIARTLSGIDEKPTPRLIVADGAESRERSIKALQARIEDISKDRDRLAGRIATLERNLGDMTGSIAQNRRTMGAAEAKPAPVATAAVEPKPPGPAEPSVPALLPNGPIMLDPLATPPVGLASILPETKPRQEPVREPEHGVGQHMATLTPPEPPKRPPHQHAEFGIELATAPNMEQLRQRWASAKANFGPLLVGLSPVAVRDHHPGSTAVRLVAGPMASVITARKLCAQFAALNGNCWPARIDPADIVR